MSLISRDFIVENKQIGQSTLWELYTSGVANVIIRLYTKNTNTDWLKEDIEKEYALNSEKLNGDTFNLKWTYDVSTFSKGNSVYVSYCFIANNEVCAIGAGEDFDCYFIVDNNAIITEVIENVETTIPDETNEASALYRQWYKIANLSNIVNDLENQHPEIIIGEDRVIQMNDNENIIIQFDNDSELITFRAKREYDGIDLLNKTLYFYGITPGAKNHIKDLVFVDTADDNDDYIIISWKVSNIFADGYGQMDFAIVAEGENATDDYLWQTHPAKMTIHPSILGDNKIEFQAISLNQWQKDLLQRVDKLESAYTNGEIKWQSLSSLNREEAE